MHIETTIIDKNNTKVIAKLHQVHFNVKIAKECENIPFIMMQLTITKTDFVILLVRHIFHKKIQEIEGSVNLGRGITPLLHSFPND